MGKTQLQKETIIYSNVLDYWLNMAIKFSDYDGYNQVNERTVALSFLSSIWECRPEVIEEKGDIA